MMLPKDKLSNEISVGAFIVYGHLVGRSGGLRIGKVLDINYQQVPMRFNPDKLEDIWKIRVIGMEDSYRDGRPVKLNSKPGVLSYPDRITVLKPEQLNQELRNLLESYVP